MGDSQDRKWGTCNLQVEFVDDDDDDDDDDVVDDSDGFRGAGDDFVVDGGDGDEATRGLMHDLRTLSVRV